jgi:hypothetical protein
MVIIVTLALLLLIFFLLRKNSGPAILAIIAGLATYEMFGLGFAAQIHSWTDWDQWVIEKVLYFSFVLFLPLLLYARSSRGGLHGILRLAQTIVFALFLTALLAQPLAEIFDFDDIATDIANWIASVQGFVIVAGLIGAYLDILFYRAES